MLKHIVLSLANDLSIIYLLWNQEHSYNVHNLNKNNAYAKDHSNRDQDCFCCQAESYCASVRTPFWQQWQTGMFQFQHTSWQLHQKGVFLFQDIMATM